MRPPRLLIGLIVSLAALLAAGLAVASADESIESTEPVDPSIVVLNPGHNYVGWVGAPLSVDGLMKRIPEITAVRAWDALRQRSYTPTNLTAGTAVRISLEEGEAVTWRRPMTPIKGLVTLRKGRNLVTWMGPNDTSLAHALLGVGQSLQSVEVWSPELQSFNRYAASALQEESELPRLSRGDAVWVEVERDTNWLQPTGVRPPIKFPGGVTPTVRERALASIDDVLRYYRESFGIEADFSQVIIYVPKDGQSLVDMLRIDFPDDHVNVGEILGNVAQGTAWVENGAPYTALPQSMWTETYDPAYGDGKSVWRGRFVTAHEYAHVLQTQLRNIDNVISLDTNQYDTPYQPPRWIVEGDGMWVMDGIHIWDGVDTWAGALDEAFSRIASRTQLHGSSDFYSFGRAAMLHMSSLVGPYAWIDFWRSLAPFRVGPTGRWQVRPTWNEAFERAFGMTVESFYAHFEQGRNRAGTRVEGRLVLATVRDGEVTKQPAPKGIELLLQSWYNVDSSSRSYTSSRARVGEDGTFSFGVIDGRYELWVLLGDCRVSYMEGSDLVVNGESIDDIEFTVPAGACAFAIAGSVRDADGLPLRQIEVYAQLDGRPVSSHAQTESDGSFAIVLSEAGVYRVKANVDGCDVYHGQGGITGEHHLARQIRVTDSDVTDVEMQLAEDTCVYRITGKLLGADGAARSGQWVMANGEAGNGGGRTAADGSFSFAVPGNGSYRLIAWVDNCGIHHGSRGAARDWNSARQITVSSADVTGIEFRLPEDPASFCD